MNIQNFMKKIIILNKYSNNHLFHLKTTRKTFNLLGSITQKSFSKKEKTEYTFLNIKQDIDFNKEYYTITTILSGKLCRKTKRNRSDFSIKFK